MPIDWESIYVMLLDVLFRIQHDTRYLLSVSSSLDPVRKGEGRLTGYFLLFKVLLETILYSPTFSSSPIVKFIASQSPWHAGILRTRFSGTRTPLRDSSMFFLSSSTIAVWTLELEKIVIDIIMGFPRLDSRYLACVPTDPFAGVHIVLIIHLLIPPF